MGTLKGLTNGSSGTGHKPDKPAIREPDMNRTKQTSATVTNLGPKKREPTP